MIGRIVKRVRDMYENEMEARRNYVGGNSLFVGGEEEGAAASSTTIAVVGLVVVMILVAAYLIMAGGGGSATQQKTSSKTHTTRNIRDMIKNFTKKDKVPDSAASMIQFADARAI